MKAVTYSIKHEIKTLAGTIESVLNAIKSEHFISEQQLFEIKVVLNELVVNALCHGNKCQLDKSTYITYKLVNNDYLYISVKDEGSGFEKKLDSEYIEVHVEETNNTLCEHGRGLIIVEGLCDKVKFNKCGNKVSIIKNLH